MSAEKAKVVKSRGFSPVWLLPVLALILAVWIITKEFMSQGPLVTIEFQSAEGIEAGKTKIKSRSVEIGIVEEVNLSDDFETAILSARIEKKFEPLLVDDTQIWVVKPRIDDTGISGLGTMLSGAYINVLKGNSDVEKLDFKGLEKPPYIPEPGPGLRLQLKSWKSYGITSGVPVSFRGFKVGKVETAEFNQETLEFEYQIFIEAEFAENICSSTRFWVDSGFQFNLDADGVRFEMGSLESLLSGGIAYDLPEGVVPGSPCENGEEFELFANYQDVLEQPYKYYAEYIMLFDRSVRGLKKGAPVEYRGIQVGSVVDVSMDYLPERAAYRAQSNSIPVLIRVDPGRFRYGDTREAVEITQKLMHDRVKMGMRAMLSTGNLLTGALYISVDYFDDLPEATIGQLGAYETIPTISTGFEQIERQVTDLLTKLNGLEVQPTLDETRKFMESAKTTLGNMDAVLQEKVLFQLLESLNELVLEMDQMVGGYAPDSRLYQTLQTVLEEIQQISENLEQYSDTLNSRPNSIIFSDSESEDPIPPSEQ
jgi:paraquat-inducible protein B